MLAILPVFCTFSSLSSLYDHFKNLGEKQTPREKEDFFENVVPCFLCKHVQKVTKMRDQLFIKCLFHCSISDGNVQMRKKVGQTNIQIHAVALDLLL